MSVFTPDEVEDIYADGNPQPEDKDDMVRCLLVEREALRGIVNDWLAHEAVVTHVPLHGRMGGKAARLDLIRRSYAALGRNEVRW